MDTDEEMDSGFGSIAIIHFPKRFTGFPRLEQTKQLDFYTSDDERRRQYKLVVYMSWKNDEISEVVHSWSKTRLIMMVNLMGDKFRCDVIDKQTGKTIYQSYKSTSLAERIND